jgi:4a-hydroxytetrahydrobiopterin dehydratase
MPKKEKACELKDQKCVPCAVGGEPLKGKEIEKLHKKLVKGWKVIKEHQIEKEYKFPDFVHALAFTNQVGDIAEREGHHPDIHLSWGKVKIILWTHKMDGLSVSDFILAAKCDEQYEHNHSETACF